MSLLITISEHVFHANNFVQPKNYLFGTTDAAITIDCSIKKSYSNYLKNMVQ